MYNCWRVRCARVPLWNQVSSEEMRDLLLMKANLLRSMIEIIAMQLFELFLQAVSSRLWCELASGNGKWAQIHILGIYSKYYLLILLLLILLNLHQVHKILLSRASNFQEQICFSATGTQKRLEGGRTQGAVLVLLSYLWGDIFLFWHSYFWPFYSHVFELRSEMTFYFFFVYCLTIACVSQVNCSCEYLRPHLLSSSGVKFPEPSRLLLRILF